MVATGYLGLLIRRQAKEALWIWGTGLKEIKEVGRAVTKQNRAQTRHRKNFLKAISVCGEVLHCLKKHKVKPPFYYRKDFSALFLSNLLMLGTLE